MSTKAASDSDNASGVAVLLNRIGGEKKSAANNKWIEVTSPSDNVCIAKVPQSAALDVDEAVKIAKQAQKAWGSMTAQKRAQVLFRYQHLVTQHCDELVSILARENGKNTKEALGDVAKGNETVEWACGIPHIMADGAMKVSRGVSCRSIRDPIGVVAAVAPFNFPFMVPMWTVPIALAAGNAVILKPSEQCPMTMDRAADLLAEAGVPPGVFQIVHGSVDVVNALCDHTGIDGVTFVGSSRVAEIVYKRCAASNKKCLALGGAKNHLVAAQDCSVDMASDDIVASFSGCAGQRCMAASVLLTLGEHKGLIDAIVSKAGGLVSGQKAGQVGAIINPASKERILKYINKSEAEGARILLDGRSWAEKPGNWVGPTVILHTNKADIALHDEIFGPVLSVLVVATPQEAIAIENASPYGNAASIYTGSGGMAEWFTERFRAGMLGVNIGVPVPREPFSFGGLEGTLSKFGSCDVTGVGCLNFMTKRRKVTSKWNVHPGVAAEKNSAAHVDAASFVGQM